MEKINNQIEITKYDKKSWLKSAILGFFLGLGVIVPGISGSTVAIIFGLYTQMLFAIGNIFSDFKRCITFLLPIGIGMVVGLIVGFVAIDFMLQIIPFATVGLFAGLMSGAFPAVKDEANIQTKSASNYILPIIGALIPIGISILSVSLNSNGLTASTSTFDNVNVGLILLCIPIGYVVGITQVVPGLSATAILMVVGWFKGLIASVSMTYWQANPMIFVVYLALGVGFLLGITTFSKLLTVLFAKFHDNLYKIIIGLSLGSIISMFYNPDTYQVYMSWANGGLNVLDLILAILLFVCGFIASFALILQQRKHNKAIESQQE